MTTMEQTTYTALDALGVQIAVERAVAAERARCAAVCREVADDRDASPTRWTEASQAFIGGAIRCAEAIERGAVER